MDKDKLWASLKVSLELEGEKRISGSNLLSLLDGILAYGSISSAASKLGFSYRYAWGLIKEAEETFDIQLVEKKAGGREGGGTSLTDQGNKFLFQYKLFKEEIKSRLEYLSYRSDRLENITYFERHLLLASTMEPVESGLLDFLEHSFFKSSSILVRHIAVGSGRALKLAREGRVDMVLTHAPELEEQFLNQGWGRMKIPLMANDFIVVGPASDPAGIGLVCSDVLEAFKKIADSKSFFISRGDQSGTHLREQKIWEAAGVETNDSWHFVFPGIAGNLGALNMAAKKNAYTIVDRASYLLARNEYLIVYVNREHSEKNHELLNNIFVLIPVNPDYVTGINDEEADHFIYWLRKEGKNIIENFGKEEFGSPLFSPI